MQGFGVHTYRLVNAKGSRSFVKFHWNPKAGTHSLVWDEAVKISGADSTSIVAICGRRSRPAPIPNGSWACRSSPKNRPRASRFDVLDATKIVPEELVPIVR
jgi:catalase